MEYNRLLDDIQYYSRSRGIRWELFFQDFDRSNSKKISVFSFRRGLGTGYPELSEANKEVLCEAFKVESGVVNYQNFCDDVDAVSTTKGLEKNPNREIVSVVGHNRHQSATRYVLKMGELIDLDHALDTLSLKVETEGIVFKNFFYDFNKSKNGFVSQEQFRRGLKSLYTNHTSEYANIVGILIKSFQDNNGDVNYRRLSRVLEEKTEQRKSSFRPNGKNTSAERYQSRPLKDEVNETILAMRRTTKTEGMRLLNFFVDLDKMRKGLIAKSQFGSAICTAFKGMHLSVFVQNALCEKYSLGDSSEISKCVRYQDFVDDIDTDSFNIRGLNSTPMKEISSYEVEIPQYLSNEEVQITDAPLMESIRSAVTMRRINMKDLFKDFDTRNRGVVTAQQFKRVLKQELHMVAMTQAEANSLCHMFATNTSDVKYNEFLRQIQPSKNSVSSPSLQYERPSTKNITNSESRDDLLMKLQRAVKSLRIRLSEFLVDFDSFSKGTITIPQFSRGLSLALQGSRISFNSEQIDVIVAPFRIPNPSHIDLVEWRKVCDEIHNLESTRFRVPAGASFFDSYSAEDHRMIAALLDQLRLVVRTSRIDIAPVFKQADKLNTGKLRTSVFRRALDTLHLSPLASTPESVFDMLALRFSVESNGLQVNYLDFVREIDPRSNYETCNVATSPSRLSKLKKTSSREAVDIDSIIKCVQDECWSSGIRIKEFMSDHDPLQKGEIPESKFKSVFSMYNIRNISQPQIETLAAHFCSSNNNGGLKVRYIELVHLIDGGNERMEMQPNSVLVPRKTRAFDERHPAQVDEAELDRVMGAISKIVKLRSIVLTPAFESYDRQKIKAITLSQFGSALKSNGLVGLQDIGDTMRILKNAFPAYHHEKIDFIKFMRNLEERL